MMTEKKLEIQKAETAFRGEIDQLRAIIARQLTQKSDETQNKEIKQRSYQILAEFQKLWQAKVKLFTQFAHEQQPTLQEELYIIIKNYDLNYHALNSLFDDLLPLGLPVSAETFRNFLNEQNFQFAKAISQFLSCSIDDNPIPAGFLNFMMNCPIKIFFPLTEIICSNNALKEPNPASTEQQESFVRTLVTNYITKNPKVKEIIYTAVQIVNPKIRVWIKEIFLELIPEGRAQALSTFYLKAPPRNVSNNFQVELIGLEEQIATYIALNHGLETKCIDIHEELYEKCKAGEQGFIQLDELEDRIKFLQSMCEYGLLKNEEETCFALFCKKNPERKEFINSLIANFRFVCLSQNPSSSEVEHHTSMTELTEIFEEHVKEISDTEENKFSYFMYILKCLIGILSHFYAQLSSSSTLTSLHEERLFYLLKWIEITDKRLKYVNKRSSISLSLILAIFEQEHLAIISIYQQLLKKQSAFLAPYCLLNIFGPHLSRHLASLNDGSIKEGIKYFLHSDHDEDLSTRTRPYTLFYQIYQFLTAPNGAAKKNYTEKQIEEGKHYLVEQFFQKLLIENALADESTSAEESKDSSIASQSLETELDSLQILTAANKASFLIAMLTSLPDDATNRCDTTRIDCLYQLLLLTDKYCSNNNDANPASKNLKIQLSLVLKSPLFVRLCYLAKAYQQEQMMAWITTHNVGQDVLEQLLDLIKEDSSLTSHDLVGIEKVMTTLFRRMIASSHGNPLRHAENIISLGISLMAKLGAEHDNLQKCFLATITEILPHLSTNLKLYRAKLADLKVENWNEEIRLDLARQLLASLSPQQFRREDTESLRQILFMLMQFSDSDTIKFLSFINEVGCSWLIDELIDRCPIFKSSLPDPRKGNFSMETEDKLFAMYIQQQQNKWHWCCNEIRKNPKKQKATLSVLLLDLKSLYEELKSAPDGLTYPTITYHRDDELKGEQGTPVLDLLEEAKSKHKNPEIAATIDELIQLFTTKPEQQSAVNEHAILATGSQSKSKKKKKKGLQGIAAPASIAVASNQSELMPKTEALVDFNHLSAGLEEENLAAEDALANIPTYEEINHNDESKSHHRHQLFQLIIDNWHQLAHPMVATAITSYSSRMPISLLSRVFLSVWNNKEQNPLPESLLKIFHDQIDQAIDDDKAAKTSYTETCNQSNKIALFHACFDLWYYIPDCHKCNRQIIPLTDKNITWFWDNPEDPIVEQIFLNLIQKDYIFSHPTVEEDFLRLMPKELEPRYDSFRRGYLEGLAQQEKLGAVSPMSPAPQMPLKDNHSLSLNSLSSRAQ